MEIAVDIIEQVVIMAMLCAVGFAARKMKILDEDSTKKLSALVINFVLPTVILVSYQKEFDEKMLSGLLMSFLLSVISYIIAFVLVPLIVRGKYKDNISVERFSAIYSNCAFMGIPLIDGVYGADGVFYLTAYVTMFNILAWTHGVVLMKGGRFEFKSMVKSLLSPSLIATVVGLVLFLVNFTLPHLLLTFAGHLSNLNTPLAMIIAGSTIATVKFSGAIKKPKLYYICFIKLILLPALIMAVCLVMRTDTMIGGVNILATACPTAALCTMLALKYGRNAGYSSELFAATTILSMITLPVLPMIYMTVAGAMGIA